MLLYRSVRNTAFVAVTTQEMALTLCLALNYTFRMIKLVESGTQREKGVPERQRSGHHFSKHDPVLPSWLVGNVARTTENTITLAI